MNKKNMKIAGIAVFVVILLISFAKIMSDNKTSIDNGAISNNTNNTGKTDNIKDDNKGNEPNKDYEKPEPSDELQLPQNKTIVFFENAVLSLDKKDVTEGDKIYKAIKAKDLTDLYMKYIDCEEVHIIYKDKTKKSEKTDDFLNSNISMTNENKPVYITKDKDKQTYTTDILSVQIDELSFVSGINMMDLVEPKEVDGTKGISLIDLLEKNNFVQCENYIINGPNNFSIALSKSDMEKGILYTDDEGVCSVKFDGMSKRTNIKGVLSISIETY